VPELPPGLVWLGREPGLLELLLGPPELPLEEPPRERPCQQREMSQQKHPQ
jgi:hypothetical protein